MMAATRLKQSPLSGADRLLSRRYSLRKTLSRPSRDMPRPFVLDTQNCVISLLFEGHTDR